MISFNKKIEVIDLNEVHLIKTVLRYPLRIFLESEGELVDDFCVWNGPPCSFEITNGKKIAFLRDRTDKKLKKRDLAKMFKKEEFSLIRRVKDGIDQDSLVLISVRFNAYCLPWIFLGFKENAELDNVNITMQSILSDAFFGSKGQRGFIKKEIEEIITGNEKNQMFI